MSDFTVIRAVTDTLKSLLENGITNSPDPQLSGVQIDLRSPKEMREDHNATGISLWLYRVTRDPDLLNRPPERISANQIRRASLPLHLYYLVTPLVTKPETAKRCWAACCSFSTTIRNCSALTCKIRWREAPTSSASILRC